MQPHEGGEGAGSVDQGGQGRMGGEQAIDELVGSHTLDGSAISVETVWVRCAQSDALHYGSRRGLSATIWPGALLHFHPDAPLLPPHPFNPRTPLLPTPERVRAGDVHEAAHEPRHTHGGPLGTEVHPSVA